MSVSFENSETRLNLMRAFAGESQARNRYTYAAGLAKRKGLEVVQQVFLFTADQERAHGKVFTTCCNRWQGRRSRSTVAILWTSTAICWTI